MSNKILYNVTVKIIPTLADDWLQWMTEVHIPDVLKTEKFESYKLSRIMDGQEDGVTYAIQYVCPDMATFEAYQQQFAKDLQKEHTERYENQYVAFRTLMEIIQAS